VLIFGVWGFPELGIRGAAYATALAGLLTLVIQGAAFFRTNALQDYVDLKNDSTLSAARLRWLVWKPDPALLLRMIRFGTPAGLHILLDLSSFTLFVILTGRMGDLAQTASNIAFSINHLAFAPLLGLSWAASAVVGQHQGAQNSVAAEKAGFTAMRMGLLYMALIGSTFVLFPQLYIALFNPKDALFSSQELLAIGRQMLIMLTIWGFFDSISIILVGALKGAGDTRFVLIYMALWSWGFFVPGSILIIWKSQNILVLWAWLALYVCLFTSGILLRWKHGKWKTIKLIHHDEPLPL
jgi:MATE family multidrug resistance protein